MNINNFGPFYSPVWGTVSDWTMVIVTTLTVIYLIKTFKAQSKSIKIQDKTLESQLQVQTIQSEQFKLEKRKHAYYTMPIFKCEVASYASDFDVHDEPSFNFPNRYWINIGLLFSHEQDIAKNVKISYGETPGQKWEDANNPDNVWEHKELVRNDKAYIALFGQGNVGIMTSPDRKPEWHFMATIEFNISFNDQFDNHLNQKITCFMSSDRKPWFEIGNPKFLTTTF
ncbi:hypothetical protein OQZ33_04315 [Pedobacter sp. MC2016-05]|uniref:hypothetical protein n=1 Tax=Pedobacter sp. MC2016-05 TaxID=2994474 RepID=UPI002246C121|nr:hypothetical protein [Pedobacter sp. MC2016-05]MCX2473550.1 hypothetical protein [Pedobacter sp. MC2016-05]